MKITFNISGSIDLIPDYNDNAILTSLTSKLAQSDKTLADAVANASKPKPHGDSDMATKTRLGDPTGNPILDGLIAQVNADQTVIGSATTLINGIAAQITAAVNTAIAGGATALQLAPLTDLTTSLATADTALAQAVANNTPTALPAPPNPPITPVVPPSPVTPPDNTGKKK